MLGLVSLVCTEIFCVEKEGIEIEKKRKEDRRMTHCE